MRRAASRARAAAIAAALVAILSVVAYAALPSLPLQYIQSELNGSFAGRIIAYSNNGDNNNNNTTFQSTTRPYLFGPVLSGTGQPIITYPPQYSALSRFALGRINMDRAKFNLSAVELSPIGSGQQHADSMLFFGYFSHWDTQGLKPYVRYSLLNGSGAVEENIAYEATHLPTFTGIGTVESAISRLENQMLNNDSLCCQNGHRDNILDPVHNRVSIGIAFNSTRLFLVQDFENYYIKLVQPMLTSGNTVRIDGNSSKSLSNLQVVVYHDPYPQNLTVAQLSQGPYSGSYSSGNFTGGVVPTCLLSCERYPGGVTVSAATWSVSPSAVRIEFQLTDFVKAAGKGVYTVYLEQTMYGRQELLVDVSFIIKD